MYIARVLLRAQGGRTPLMVAASWGFEAVVHELMAARADAKAADKVSSISPQQTVSSLAPSALEAECSNSCTHWHIYLSLYLYR